MAIIAPTILTDNTELYKKLVESYASFAQRIQIDFMDGEFAPDKSVGIDDLWWPDGLMVDMHMMVARPREYIEKLIALRPRLVIFHAEVEGELNSEFLALKNAGIKTGVALLKGTFPGSKKELIERVDHVLLFSGNLGEYGGEADLLQLSKVGVIRDIKSGLEIGWDGGANESNVGEMARAGVNVINVGSAIAKAENPKEAYEKLMAEANKGGEV